MEQFQLSYIDIGIMVVYGILIIGYGLYHAKRDSSEEYFLAGRDMTWPIVGIALFAANISSSTLVGLAGDAFQTNAHVYNYEWFAVVVLIFFSIFFLPFYLRSKVYTMPEFLERRYDSRSRYYFSFITIVGNIVVDTASGLYVGNLILKIIFPELDTWVIIAILAFAAAAYTIPGGLNSVIQTEVIQAVLLIFGSCILTYYAFAEVGGWSALVDGLNAKNAAGELALNSEEIFSLIRPSTDEFMPWTGLLLGIPILGFYYWANNQFMVQRILGAKDLNHGRWGALFAGLLKLPVIVIMVMPGVLAILLYSDLDLTALNYSLPSGEMCTNLADCPNMTYPVLLFNLLPTGLLGIVLAGVLAAMMSSLSATFNSASTLITMDFVQKFKPELTSKQLVKVGQIATIVLVILASAWAPQIERFGSLFKYLQIVLSFICPPIVAVFILGLFWKRANSTGSFAALMTGFVIAVSLLITYAVINNYEENYEPTTQSIDMLSNYVESDTEEAIEFVTMANKKVQPEKPQSINKLLRFYEANYTNKGKELPLIAVDFVKTAEPNMQIFSEINNSHENYKGEMSNFLKFIGGIHFLHMTAYLTLLCVLIHVLVSLMTPAPDHTQIQPYIYTKEFFDEDTRSLEGLPWYQNFRILSVLLLIVTAMIVGYFW